ncbi:MAG: hypothetical protein P4K98_00080 [Bryobacteraceae bacterium]|nr:hypothetical protein [Bryobacteraceae bacterium]
MRKIYAGILLLLMPVCLAAQCTSSVAAQGSYGVPEGASGAAQYVVFLPQPTSCYNGTMILFAHGYVPVGAPANAWQSQLALPDGTSLPALLNSLGFGFAASSYSKDGLAILQGVQDTKALTNVIHALSIPVNRYFVTGASEGGLVATKSVENDPTYSGAIAVCGPIGSFRKQLNYFGDVRVLFDYFFPGVLTTGTPGESAINIPPALLLNWTTVYEPAVRKAVNSNVLATLQLVLTARIPIGLNLNNAADAIVDALWYNVFATSDAQATLGGNPYDNIGVIYSGSFRDAHLNAVIPRFAASSTALTSIQQYETSGQLHDPLVTLHTLADPVVPFWHEALYAAKAHSTGSSSELVQIPVLRFGHCNVTAADAEAAMAALLLKAGQ